MTSALIQEAILSGIHFLFVFLILIFLYFTWKALMLLSEWLISGNEHKKSDLKILAKGVLYFTLFFVISFIIFSASINWVNQQADLNIIPVNNQYLMELDKILFGSYVPFWFQDINNPYKTFFDFISPLLTFTYRLITAVIALLFIIVLAKNQTRFYQFFLAFVLCLIISLPLWYAIPALTPNYAYYQNILNNPISTPIKKALSTYKPNDNLHEFLLRKINTTYIASKNSVLITTLPSMHVAWATVALYFAIQISWWLAIFMIPYYLLNFIATIFTLQHYAVDSLVGIIIGILAIILAKLIIRKKDSASALPTISTLIQEDLKSLIKFLRTL
ncbi:MAG: phosphatase PAP2 family protein [Patescibacteria group bacterium]